MNEVYIITEHSGDWDLYHRKVVDFALDEDSAKVLAESYAKNAECLEDNACYTNDDLGLIDYYTVHKVSHGDSVHVATFQVHELSEHRLSNADAHNRLFGK